MNGNENQDNNSADPVDLERASGERFLCLLLFVFFVFFVSFLFERSSFVLTLFCLFIFLSPRIVMWRLGLCVAVSGIDRVKVEFDGRYVMRCGG